MLQCTVQKKPHRIWKLCWRLSELFVWVSLFFLVYAIDTCVYFIYTSCFLIFFFSFFYLSIFIFSSVWNRRESISTVPSSITVHNLFLTNTLFRRNVIFEYQIVCYFHRVGYNNKYLSLLHFYLLQVWKELCYKFDVFSTVHHSIDLFHLPNLMHNSFIP